MFLVFFIEVGVKLEENESLPSKENEISLLDLFIFEKNHVHLCHDNIKYHDNPQLYRQHSNQRFLPIKITWNKDLYFPDMSRFPVSHYG